MGVHGPLNISEVGSGAMEEIYTIKTHIFSILNRINQERNSISSDL
jgi:hypothetical protein